MMKLIIFASLLVLIPFRVDGHGMVLEPVNRASRWKFNDSAPINFDDNGLFCGGYLVQWFQNNGKCGLCGDDFADPTPRTNELGGSIFGEGVIVKNYSIGAEVPVEVLVTANHLGFFKFKLCNLDKFRTESEECFDDISLKLSDGQDRFVINENVGPFYMKLKLPEDLVCEHCVLQWTWTTANSWGDCDDGSIQQGCGAQENFRTCSDISILP